MKRKLIHIYQEPELDHVALERFTAAMRERLIESTVDRSGWTSIEYPISEFIARCRHNLSGIESGTRYAKNQNLIDAANYLMFIWNRRNPYG